MMHKIPKLWYRGETVLTSEYQPSTQSVCIVAQRFLRGGTVGVDHLVSMELLDASKVNLKDLVNVITDTLVTAIDLYIERETRANTAD